MNEEILENQETILDIVQKEIGLHDNNIKANAAHLRDTFLKAEQDYFIYLVTTQKHIIDMIREYNLYDAKELYQLAEKLTQEMEFGLVDELDEQKYEDMLIVLTAAIKDKRKRLILEKIYTESHGRSR